MPSLRTASIVGLGGVVLAFTAAESVIGTPQAARADTTTRQRVVAKSPVHALAAGGSLAVYATAGSCNLYIWSIATGRVTSFEAGNDECATEGYISDVAMSRRTIAWSEYLEFNRSIASVRIAPKKRLRPVTTLHSESDQYIAALAASGEVISFSSQEGTDGGGPDATLWVGTKDEIAPIVRAAGWMERIALDGGLVALGYRDGRVRVYSTEGRRLAGYSGGTASDGLELSDGAVLTLSRGRLAVRTVGGAIRLSHPVRGERVELLDARDGIAVYRSGRTLRLQRLADGRDVGLGFPTTSADYLHAAFSDLGLVVAHQPTSRGEPRGVVALLRWSELERILG